MTIQLVSVLLLLAVSIIMFVINRPRMDAVALIVICVLPLTGSVTASEALQGFSDPNVILIIALFILGEGLVRTGVVRKIGDTLLLRAGNEEVRLMMLLMIAACSLGAFMSSTAVTAIFIPVVLRICRKTGMHPGKLMMPLSIAALISGMTTLIATTPNLIINSELMRRGEDGFNFFSFTPFGVLVLILSILYMKYARRWLSSSAIDSETIQIPRPTFLDWVTRYNLAEKGSRLIIKENSSLIGKTMEVSDLRQLLGVNIIAIQRHNKLIPPSAKTYFHKSDKIFVELLSSPGDFDLQVDALHLQILPLTGDHFTDFSQEMGMAEVIVTADSAFLDKTIIESKLRSKLNLSVIGIRRGIDAIKGDHREEKLKIGDTLLVTGRWKAITNLSIRSSRDLVPITLPIEFDDILPAAGKMIPAILILLFVVLMMITGVMPNVQAALIGCLFMGLFGCVDYESAYHSIDWKTIVLIVGMLPFAIALQRTGGIDMVSTALISNTVGVGTYGTLALLFLMTSIFGIFISNTATAVLMAPVALTTASHLNASPYPFAMIVALAASAAFMTPVSSPVNTLVVTPGGYRFLDFFKVGFPLTIIVMIVSVIFVPLLLPL